MPATAAPPGTPIPNCHFWRGKLKFVDDGDTIDVRLPTSTGKRKTVRVRITGIQAMEQSVYTSNPRKRRGECHALPATARLEQLLKAGRGTVRLAAQDPQSASGGRLRRSVAVKVAGVWQDVGRALVAEGHVLWLPSSVEYAWNSTYETLAQQAALAGVNLWDTDSCGGGPSATAVLRVTVHPNAKGSDFQNLNGERVKIENLDLTAPVSLAGWCLRDSTLRKLRVPLVDHHSPRRQHHRSCRRRRGHREHPLLGPRRPDLREPQEGRPRHGRRRVPVRPAGRSARVDDVPVLRRLRAVTTRT